MAIEASDGCTWPGILVWYRLGFPLAPRSWRAEPGLLSFRQDGKSLPDAHDQKGRRVSRRCQNFRDRSPLAVEGAKTDAISKWGDIG